MSYELPKDGRFRRCFSGVPRIRGGALLPNVPDPPLWRGALKPKSDPSSPSSPSPSSSSPPRWDRSGRFIAKLTLSRASPVRPPRSRQIDPPSPKNFDFCCDFIEGLQGHQMPLCNN